MEVTARTSRDRRPHGPEEALDRGLVSGRLREEEEPAGAEHPIQLREARIDLLEVVQQPLAGDAVELAVPEAKLPDVGGLERCSEVFVLQLDPREREHLFRVVDADGVESTARKREGHDAGPAAEVERSGARPLRGYAVEERPEQPLVVDGELARNLVVVRGRRLAMELDVATRDLVGQSARSSGS